MNVRFDDERALSFEMDLLEEVVDDDEQRTPRAGRQRQPRRQQGRHE